MPQSYKRLNSIISNASLSTPLSLYTCTTTAAVVSTISVCNTSASTVTYRICVTTAAASSTGTTFPADINGYIVYDGTIVGNDTSFVTVGLTLDSTNKYLLFSSSAASLAVSAFGVEIS